MRQNLSLAQLKIAEPCSQDWDRMSGDAQKKFCEGCQRHVHNLSAMTQTAIEDLLCATSGRLCVRYDFNADGSVKTLDYEPAPIARHGWKFWTVVGGTLATLVAGAQAVMKPTPPPPTPASTPAVMSTIIMGVVAYNGPPTTGPSRVRSEMGDVSFGPDPTAAGEQVSPLQSAMHEASSCDPGLRVGPPPIMGKPAPPPVPDGPTTRGAE